MGRWQGMLGMLPQTFAQSTWGQPQSPFDPYNALSQMFGWNIPGGGDSNMNLQQALAVIQQELGGG